MTEQRLTQITVVDKDLVDLLPGEMTCDASRKYWYIGCPQCKEPGSLSDHHITENEQGVTVSPSLVCSCSAHFFVRQSKIEWC